MTVHEQNKHILKNEVLVRIFGPVSETNRADLICIRNRNQNIVTLTL